jgi:hypothetical protein
MHRCRGFLTVKPLEAEGIECGGNMFKDARRPMPERNGAIMVEIVRDKVVEVWFRDSDGLYSKQLEYPKGYDDGDSEDAEDDSGQR